MLRLAVFVLFFVGSSVHSAGSADCGDGICQRGESPAVCPVDCGRLSSSSNGAGLIVDASLAPRGVALPDGGLLLGVKRTIGRRNVIQAIAGKPGGAWVIRGVVEENMSPKKADLGNPSPFFDKDGRVLMAFRDHLSAAAGVTYQLRVEYSDDKGVTWNRWNSGDDGLIDRSAFGLWEPFLYRDAYGDLRVVYAKERAPQPCNGRPVEKQDVVMKVSRDGGRSWGDEQIVASAGLSREGVPTVAQLRDGSYVLVFESWRNETCQTLNPRLVIRYMQSRDGAQWGNRKLLYSPAPLHESPGSRLHDYPIASWPFAIRLQDGRLLVLFTTNENHPDPDGKFAQGEKSYDIKYRLTKYEASYEDVEWEEVPARTAYARSVADDDVRFASAVELNDRALVFLFARPARYKAFELR